VYLVSAEKYLREGDFTKALDWGDKALTAGDDKASVYYLYARIEAARQNRPAERRWLERTLELAPGNGAARLRLGELLRDAGLWHKAIDEYQTVLKMEPGNLHAYLGLSAIYAQHAQPRRAAEIIAEALTHHPGEISLYMRQGDLHAQRGAPVEAEAAYDRAARLGQGEDRALALDRLGDLYLGAGRHHEAFICFAEASKLRAGTASVVAEKRYQHVLGAADEALQKALTQADRALQSYLAGGETTRAEAYQSLTDANTQVQEARELAEVLVAPDSLRLEHARRKLAYTLARESLTNGLVYLDTSRAEALADYRLRLEETRRSFKELARPRG
jgi:tetratricopeptide (TPR) repeat protein